MAYCQQCGTQVTDPNNRCPTCGWVPPAPVQLRRTEGGAIASLVLGIIGLTMCPFIPSIIAIILGSQAKQRLVADPTLDGEAFARVGVILGWIGVALFGGGLLLVMTTSAFSYLGPWR
jgi:hypothetical protein